MNIVIWSQFYYFYSIWIKILKLFYAGLFFFWLQLDFIKVYWNNTADSPWDAQGMSFGGKYVGQVLNQEEEVCRTSRGDCACTPIIGLLTLFTHWHWVSRHPKEGQLVILQPCSASLKHSEKLRVLAELLALLLSPCSGRLTCLACTFSNILWRSTLKSDLLLPLALSGSLGCHVSLILLMLTFSSPHGS